MTSCDAHRSGADGRHGQVLAEGKRRGSCRHESPNDHGRWMARGTIVVVGPGRAPRSPRRRHHRRLRSACTACRMAMASGEGTPGRQDDARASMPTDAEDYPVITPPVPIACRFADDDRHEYRPWSTRRYGWRTPRCQRAGHLTGPQATGAGTGPTLGTPSETGIDGRQTCRSVPQLGSAAVLERVPIRPMVRRRHRRFRRSEMETASCCPTPFRSTETRRRAYRHGTRPRRTVQISASAWYGRRRPSPNGTTRLTSCLDLMLLIALASTTCRTVAFVQDLWDRQQVPAAPTETTEPPPVERDSTRLRRILGDRIVELQELLMSHYSEPDALDGDLPYHSDALLDQALRGCLSDKRIVSSRRYGCCRRPCMTGPLVKITTMVPAVKAAALRERDILQKRYPFVPALSVDGNC